VLAIDAVSVRRGSTLTLHNISLNVAAGSTVAVVGESGAGKSTLIAAVLGPVVAQGETIAPDTLTNLCERLELSIELLDRRPGEVSIGQAQRAGILRALIAESPLVLFDEPLSALDAVTQKYTARLIAELQSERGFASLIVTHDLGYAAAYGDEIAVLRAGHIEEVTASHNFVAQPLTEYGCTLRNAAIALGALQA